MMLALILAQLVLPWPGLDSPLVQPPGMICLGACAGPVIYGAAEQRGRLVVACDMRSDTCSDGRQITTTRATPVPCETSPGVWETVGVDQGCYSVRGLESWAQNTSYLSYGAELDRSPWGGVATATKVGSTYRICADEPGNFRQQLASESGGQVRTAACRVRADTSNSIRLLAADLTSGGTSFDYTLTADWQTVTATATIMEGGGVAGVRLHPARSAAGCIDVVGCWSVRGTSPGRPCWGGEAPVTCDNDRHTISTEGWPTESGEISVVFSPGPNGTTRFILDSRTSMTNGTGIYVYLLDNGGLVAGMRRGAEVSARNSGPTEWGDGNHVLRFQWNKDSAGVWVDGAQVLSWAPGNSTPDTHRVDAMLGINISHSQNLNGSISSLRVRSTP